mgnify:CR=1 FL=1
MKRIAFLVLLLIGISTTLSFAQSQGRVTVTGTVLDKEDDSPVMQASATFISVD